MKHIADFLLNHPFSTFPATTQPSSPRLQTESCLCPILSLQTLAGESCQVLLLSAQFPVPVPLALHGLRVPTGSMPVPTSALPSRFPLCLAHPPCFSMQPHPRLPPRCGSGGGCFCRHRPLLWSPPALPVCSPASVLTHGRQDVSPPTHTHPPHPTHTHYHPRDDS